MIFVFYFFAALLIWLSYRSFRGGIEYLRYFRVELAKSPSDFTPFATIIAPCRGVDEGMRENLTALFEQDYPKYEILFVVADADDSAVSVIEEEITRRNSAIVASNLIVATKATDCSQKVENLREAVLHVAGASCVFAFVDSDARPAKNWLRSLVAPLENDGVGATTGYRWFISEKPTFATEMNSVWNASIATALGAKTDSNFCWGGSMAMRRDTFERIDMREKWRGTLSDDFAVTRAMNEAKLPIVFVPQAMCASIENCSFGKMLEFTTRQMKITRVYAPTLWILSFVGSGLFNAVILAAILIIIFNRENTLHVVAAITTLFLVCSFSVGKAYLRLKAVRLILTTHDTELRRQTFAQTTLFLFTPIIFFYNSVAALLSRRLTWRGTIYELKSPSETVIITGK